MGNLFTSAVFSKQVLHNKISVTNKGLGKLWISALVFFLMLTILAHFPSTCLKGGWLRVLGVFFTPSVHVVFSVYFSVIYLPCPLLSLPCTLFVKEDVSSSWCYAWPLSPRSQKELSLRPSRGAFFSDFFQGSLFFTCNSAERILANVIPWLKNKNDKRRTRGGGIKRTMWMEECVKELRQVLKAFQKWRKALHDD